MSRGIPVAHAQGTPANPFAPPPLNIHMQPPFHIHMQPQPEAPEMGVSTSKRGNDDDNAPRPGVKKSNKAQRPAIHDAAEYAAQMQQEAAAAASQLAGEDWSMVDPAYVIAAESQAKQRSADPEIAIDLAMKNYFHDPTFMKMLRNQAKEDGTDVETLKNKWVQQIMGWMEPAKPKAKEAPPPAPEKKRQASRSHSAAEAPKVPKPASRPQSEAPKAPKPASRPQSEAPREQRSVPRWRPEAEEEPKPRQSSRSRSAAPPEEEQRPRPSRGRPKEAPKPSQAPRAQSETAKPKPRPSKAPAAAEKREESIETLPATSVPPRARSQPAKADAEEEKPKPQKPKETTKAQLGKVADALKEYTQRSKKVKNMQLKMDKQLEEAKTRGRKQAEAEPLPKALLPTFENAALLPDVPATQSRQRSASVSKGKKHANTPSPAAKKPRASTGTPARGRNAAHRTTLPESALVTGHGKPKAKGRPKKAVLESIPEIPVAPKRGRGRPKKVVVLADRIAVQKPVMPYNDVGNDPYLNKSHRNNILYCHTADTSL